MPALPPERRESVRKLATFVAVGATSAACDFGVFWLLSRVGLYAGLASACGFLSAFVINYRGNRDLVFRAGKVPGAMVRYVVLVAVNLGLSTGIVAGLVALGVPALWSKLISMVVVAAFNFVMMRAWVFRPRVPR
jgi:putative flippase GtrA